MEPFWICQKESSTGTFSIRSAASSSISSALLHLPNRNYKWYSIRQFLQLQHHLALELKPVIEIVEANNITKSRKIQKQLKRIKRVIRFDTMEIDRRESRNRNNNDNSTELILILILKPRDREYSSYSFRTCWKFFFDDNSNTALVSSSLIWFDLIGLWREYSLLPHPNKLVTTNNQKKEWHAFFSILSHLNEIKWDWIEWLSNWVNERENGIVGMGVSEWVREQCVCVCVCVCVLGRQTASTTVQQMITHHTKKWSLVRLCTPFYVPCSFGTYKDDSILETSTSIR